QLRRVDALGVGPVDDLVIDIGEVLDVVDLVASMLEVASDHVEQDVRHDVPDVRRLVYRDAADIHADLTGLDCLEGLDRSGESVVDRDVVPGSGAHGHVSVMLGSDGQRVTSRATALAEGGARRRSPSTPLETCAGDEVPGAGDDGADVAALELGDVLRPGVAPGSHG